MMLQFNPPVIAHRGASGDAPENTMAAFTRALQYGIQWVEFDVMLAACGTPIIFHDETLDRTTNATGCIGSHSAVWLRSLDAGAWFNSIYAGECIPTLAQLTAFLAETGLCANIEIKPLPGQDAQTVLAALQEVSAFFPEQSPSILFSSFSIPALKLLRQHAPTANLGLLMHEWLPDWRDTADALCCVSVHVNNEVLTEQGAHEIKAAGKQLLCYTVNDACRAETLFGWGVDAVFSDFPDHIARLV
jgi:glycerophosphoryl diester phosphodiesterase